MGFLERRKQKIYEDYGYILDFPVHKPTRRRRFPGGIAQLVGERFFLLLEAVVRPGVTLEIGERVFVGRNHRAKILFILGPIDYDELTDIAKTELERVIEKIVRENEDRFIEFFNRSSSISPRMHALELIPGIGKKYMRIILRERGVKPFDSFEEMQKRAGLPDPAKLVARRIVDEIKGLDVKYRLFTAKIPRPS